MEKSLEVENTGNLDVLVQRITADYFTIKGVEEKYPEIKEPTFAEVYEGFYKWKFENDKTREYSKAAKSNYQVAFKNCSAIHNRTFSSPKHNKLQGIVDPCLKELGLTGSSPA